MRINYNKQLYSRQALLKAAFHFTDEYYVRLDCDEQYYFVEIVPKKNSQIQENIYEEFGNELLAQATREAILENTSELRQLILGRAFASTIIDSLEENAVDSELSDDNAEDNINEDDEGLFEDWYETENKNS